MFISCRLNKKKKFGEMKKSKKTALVTLNRRATRRARKRLSIDLACVLARRAARGICRSLPLLMPLRHCAHCALRAQQNGGSSSLLKHKMLRHIMAP